MNRKSRIVRAGVVAAGLACCAPAAAHAGLRQDFTLAFTTQHPASPTGLTFHLRYKDPSDPNRKPPALTGLVIRLPSGTGFETRSVPVCAASDTQLETEGPSACPDGSRLGSGTFTAMTGIPPLDPFVATDLIYNGGNALIEDVVFKGTQVTAGVDRLTIQGSTLTAHPPDTPGGPPDGRTVPREIDATIPARGPFVHTPASCPAGNRWVATSTATFADDGSETDASTIACRAPHPGSRDHRRHRERRWGR